MNEPYRSGFRSDRVGFTRIVVGSGPDAAVVRRCSCPLQRRPCVGIGKPVEVVIFVALDLGAAVDVELADEVAHS